MILQSFDRLDGGRQNHRDIRIVLILKELVSFLIGIAIYQMDYTGKSNDNAFHENFSSVYEVFPFSG